LPRPTVQITGASIAGPALAYWLGARGWETTVGQAQKLAPGAPRIANPRSRAGVAIMNTALRLAAPVVERVGGLASKLLAPPADAIDLPTYPAPGTTPVAEVRAPG
jgi:hypothetical protein